MSSSGLHVDIAGLIIATVVLILFFDMFYSWIHYMAVSMQLGINFITSLWKPDIYGGLFYEMYKKMYEIFNWSIAILKDRYAVAVLVAASLAYMGLELRE